MDKVAKPSGLSYVVLACPKSGTTWMQRLLSAHDEVHCAESRLFGNFVSTDFGDAPRMTLEAYVSILSSYYHPPCARAEGEAYFQSLLYKLVETIAEHAKAESGKRIYGEKLTPYLGTMDRVIEQLGRYGDGLKVIHLVRDARDVIVSGSAHWKQLQSQEGKAGDPETAFAYLLDSWIEIQHAMEHATQRFDQVLVVRYEDMLDDPLGQARRVFSFLEAHDDPDLIRRCVEATSFFKLSGGRSPGEEDPSSFFRNGTAGQWKDRLTPEQIQRVHDRAGGLLEAYGYATAECFTR